MEKQKYQLEFDMKGTPVPLLWSYISSASGLKEWFADAVEIDGKQYTFYWNKQPQSATVLSMRSEVSVRWRWDDEPSRAYFELKIQVNDFTGTSTLILTDFAEPSELDDARELWTTQIDGLRTLLGC